MAQELERKFLIDILELDLKGVEPHVITQGYIPRGNGTTVRIRTSNSEAYLTIKGKTTGISRSEYEYEIPFKDAMEMLDEVCDERLIEKVRYIVPHEGHKWEVDFFKGDNKGLIVAEIELESEDEEFSIPNWVTNEVTDDERYYNANLIENPYKDWNKS